MAEKLDDYEKLLKDLSFRVSEEDQMLIRRSLQKASKIHQIPRRSLTDLTKDKSPEPYDIRDLLASGKASDTEQTSGTGGENQVSARAGSTGSTDFVDEDFNRDATSRATGFLGKNSEVVWLQRLSRRATSVPLSDDSETGSGYHDAMERVKSRFHGVSDSTYHCDDLSIIITDQVDAFELPPKPIADVLFQAYLETVHPAFPILGRSTFVSQYKNFSNSPGIDTGNNWRAILNLIFAIAAKYLHLVQSELRGDDRDHLVYFTRARMLGFNGESVLAHPELQQVQITGLMAFYLAAINQINRQAGLFNSSFV